MKNQCRTNTNKLGFAVNLSYMRYPGIILALELYPSKNLTVYWQSTRNKCFRMGKLTKKERTYKNTAICLWI
ncbi:DUF4158 domain-containing protein [Chryseobacterium fluminis]|uniref:DUF4158 domain-containing protein n=1 Tax=Chryseobacterium fluminis TaxID=2983606 RepID=UPI0038CC1652